MSPGPVFKRVLDDVHEKVRSGTALSDAFASHGDLFPRVYTASLLIHVKSRMLLPVDQQVTDSEAEEGEDPRWELIRQLVEYKKFKDAALQLGQREEEQARIFPRRGAEAGASGRGAGVAATSRGVPHRI